MVRDMRNYDASETGHGGQLNRNRRASLISIVSPKFVSPEFAAGLSGLLASISITGIDANYINSLKVVFPI